MNTWQKLSALFSPTPVSPVHNAEQLSIPLRPPQHLYSMILLAHIWAFALANFLVLSLWFLPLSTVLLGLSLTRVYRQYRRQLSVECLRYDGEFSLLVKGQRLPMALAGEGIALWFLMVLPLREQRGGRRWTLLLPASSIDASDRSCLLRLLHRIP